MAGGADPARSFSVNLWLGWKRLSLSAPWVVPQSVSVQHSPPSSVNSEGKAREADENNANPLRIAEY